MQKFRLATGGDIDRGHPVRFEFNGAPLEGYRGDTLASALLAHGRHLVGRSFKYHRPRGIFSAGAEEPSALVQIARGARTEPNARATVVEVHDGLVARSQNCWPSVRFDLGAINNVVSRLIPAGFYYKTFMWPPTPAAWLRYEHWIRRAAGMGRSATSADPDRYDQRFAHCDVLVVGGGVAGLAAARAAAGGGARVIVCDETPRWGGLARRGASSVPIDGAPRGDWIDTCVDDLAGAADVTMLSRSTAFGYYDGNLVGAVERVTHHLAAPLPPFAPRERLWLIRAKAVVLASGAHERGIAYPDNDRPGTMLLSAARTYVERFGVRPGTCAVVFANHDGAYDDALALRDAGIEIAAVVDPRDDAAMAGVDVRRARDAGLPVHARSLVLRAHGGHRVHAVDVAAREGGKSQRIDCDLVCVAGGWSPAVHLFSQARGTLRYDEAIAAFVPDASPLPIVAAGAANGCFDDALLAADGTAAGEAALALARAASPSPAAVARPPRAPGAAPVEPLWTVPAPYGAKRFVDLQNDVTVDDVALAKREGYQSVEHLKRYTTLGMGTDQGKTSNVPGLALMAAELGTTIPAVGTTTFRPPYTPVTMGAFPGAHTGPHVEPVRRSAMHAWHASQGARFVNAGLWKRPHSYPRTGESEDDAARREAINVRRNVGVVDVSTLGKIELQGRDAAAFLNRVYINRFDSLAVGRCRYGVMLRDDGMVMDDGTTSRLADTHFLVTTTTVNAVRVMQHFEYLLQVAWPTLEVYATSVTEQWSAAAISGPRARDVVAALVDLDVSNAAFPFLAVGACRVRTADGEVPGRLFRMSYSGELAYELHVPTVHGLAAWEAIIAAGAPFGLMPYGTEAMSTLRIEKGHVVVGAEADGRTTADDLGLGKLVNAGKWCVGKPLLGRPALVADDRWQLVGLTAQHGAVMPRGGKLVADPDRAPPIPMQGHITSWCESPHVGAWIGLALLAGGRARHGETLWAVSPLADQRVRVTVGPPAFIDPEGTRLRG
jgi:sarcosine oxidase subunit alpha